MSKQKIITAKFKKNKFAQCALWIGLPLVILGVIIAFVTYDTYGCRYEGFLGHVFTNMFCFAVAFGCFGTGWIVDSVITYLGIISLICYTISAWMMNNCSMEVTSNRVTGKASFGQTVDLPLSQISAVGLGIFNRITVATSSGKINFWLVDNREDVRSVLLELLSAPQQEKNDSQKASNTVSSADELRKYKELLDSGIITQEEFKAKKNQLLGL